MDVTVVKLTAVEPVSKGKVNFGKMLVEHSDQESAQTYVARSGSEVPCENNPVSRQ